MPLFSACAQPLEAVMNSQLQYHHALERVKELREQAARERLLKPHKVSWRVRSAKVLHSLAQRLDPNETVLETI
jgi:hypothetical protein